MNNRFTFRDQYHLCAKEEMIGLSEGEELVMEMAFPNKAYLSYVETHGNLPTLKASACKRFGGNYSSQNEKCRELVKSKNHVV